MIQEIHDKVWHVDSGVSGPSLFIIGGVHGNERTGVDVIKKLVSQFQTGAVTLQKGILTLALGNIPAIEKNIRYIDNKDLNRFFSQEHLSGPANGSYEEERARLMAKIISQNDITIDLHATNKPSVAFVVCKNDLAHQEVYRWFAPRYVLIDSNFVLGGEPVATSEYAHTLGKVGMCIEVGWVDDPETFSHTYSAIESILKDLEMIAGIKEAPPTQIAEVFILKQAIYLTEHGFTFAENKGNSSFEPIAKDEIVGYQGVVPIYSEYSGVIIFPKKPEHQQLGKPVCYIAQKVS